MFTAMLSRPLIHLTAVCLLCIKSLIEYAAAFQPHFLFPVYTAWAGVYRRAFCTADG